MFYNIVCQESLSLALWELFYANKFWQSTVEKLVKAVLTLLVDLV